MWNEKYKVLVFFISKFIYTHLISGVYLSQQEWVTFVISGVDYETHQTDDSGQNNGQGQAQVQRPMKT